MDRGSMSVLSVAAFLILPALVSCTEYVPVLLWSSQSSAHPFAEVPAFSRISTNDFTEYVLKRVRHEKPTILAFVEESLSAEDFSLKDYEGNAPYPLVKATSKASAELAYLPNVEDPVGGLKALTASGYTWEQYNNTDFESLDSDRNYILEVKLDEADMMTMRSDLIKQHDEKISQIYKDALSLKDNILAIYSGSHNPWYDAEVTRSKRDVSVSDDPDQLIITDDKNVVLMSVTPPIVYTVDNGPGKEPTVVNITKVNGIPTTDIEPNKISMTVRFPFVKEDISVKFYFASEQDDWWSLTGAEILNLKQKDFVPLTPVEAPSHYSYFCNPAVVFVSGPVSLKFENFQVQPRVGKGQSFGPSMHCIPYFSIAIWSGLIVVAILSAVLAWGVVMIMDINTNDRFDDPKGKTITISATD